MTAPRCGTRFGKRRQYTCKRLPRHRGPHRLRATAAELAALLRRARR